MQHPIFVDMYTSDMWRIFLEGRRKRLVVRNKCGDLSVEAAGLAHVLPCCTFSLPLSFSVAVGSVTRTILLVDLGRHTGSLTNRAANI